MQNEYIDTIVLMAYKLQVENPDLTDDEAIKTSIQNFLDSQAELVNKLNQIKEKLGKEDWQKLIEIFTDNKKSPDELATIYQKMLASNQLINGVTTSTLELSVDYEGASIFRVFPAGTKVKISKHSWQEQLEFIEIWTSPKSVDYCLRGNILAY